MGKSEMTVLTNMCMVSDGRGNVLVQDRRNPDWPGLTFPGGHVEPGESLAESVIREVREETGLTIEGPKLCGVKWFYTRGGERYLVFLYRTDRYCGTLRASEEGEVFWLPLADFDRYTWAPDFGDMVKVFCDDDLSEVFYRRVDGELRTDFY